MGRKEGGKRVRVVITGASGMIGRALSAKLADRGMDVFCVVHPDDPNRFWLTGKDRISLVYRDIREADAIGKEVGHADLFFHFAWIGTDPKSRESEEQEDNILWTRKLLETAYQLGCKAFYFAGSQAEYGDVTGATSEKTVCHPFTAYGKAKKAVFEPCRKAAEEYGIRYYHLRFYSIYGPGDKDRTLPMTLLKGLSAGQEVAVSACTNTWNFTYVEDIVLLLEKMAEQNPPSGIYNLASDDTRVLSDFVREIEAIVGKGSVSFGRYQPSEKIVSLEPDIHKILEAVGPVSFTPFSEGIRETLRSMP